MGVVFPLLAMLPHLAFAQRDLSGPWSARYHEDQEHQEEKLCRNNFL
jgi:hypothetical protein